MAGVKTLQAAIEAILFTMGESVELSKIAKAIRQDEQTTEELLRSDEEIRIKEQRNPHH